jgi:S-adenosylmethionine:tRNA ribosyltransferase-isomerase
MTEVLSDYDFDLPSELIAQAPSPIRSEARLLIVRKNPTAGEPRFEDLLVRDLPQFLDREKRLKNSIWFRNRSKVFPARFYARRKSGSRHEIVLIQCLDTQKNLWKAMLRNSRRFDYPETLTVESASEYGITIPSEGVVDLSGLGPDPMQALQEFGEMPLPPYITERNPDRDRSRYQSVWALASAQGSAAAPTASLHFDEKLVEQMKARVSFEDLVLHVGLGTFEALRENEVGRNRLHSEKILIPAAAAAKLTADFSSPRVAVGTTALRTMESFAYREDLTEVRLEPTLSGDWNGSTEIFIRPGFEFRTAQALMTNFHLPKSSLLILLSAFAGSRELVMEAYRHAITKKYRFFSYGDATLWI